MSHFDLLISDTDLAGHKYSDSYKTTRFASNSLWKGDPNYTFKLKQTIL